MNDFPIDYKSVNKQLNQDCNFELNTTQFIHAVSSKRRKI